eukprot:1195551-Amphidinium_carterae.1
MAVAILDKMRRVVFHVLQSAPPQAPDRHQRRDGRVRESGELGFMPMVSLSLSSMLGFVSFGQTSTAPRGDS